MAIALGFVLGLYIAGYIALFLAIVITCGLKEIPWWGWVLTPFYPAAVVWVIWEEVWEIIRRKRQAKQRKGR